VKFPAAALAFLLLAAIARPCAAESGACCASAHAKSKTCASSSTAKSISSASGAAAKSASGSEPAAYARGLATGAHRCSMPYGTPCDPGASPTSTVTARASGAVEVAGAAAHAPHVSAPAIKTVARAPEPAGEPPAFGPLFLAHQALML
jgi:hypothetical protein